LPKIYSKTPDLNIQTQNIVHDFKLDPLNSVYKLNVRNSTSPNIYKSKHLHNLNNKMSESIFDNNYKVTNNHNISKLSIKLPKINLIDKEVSPN